MGSPWPRVAAPAGFQQADGMGWWEAGRGAPRRLGASIFGIVGRSSSPEQGASSTVTGFSRRGMAGMARSGGRRWCLTEQKGAELEEVAA
jgi:hypothetical protein